MRQSKTLPRRVIILSFVFGGLISFDASAQAPIDPAKDQSGNQPAQTVVRKPTKFATQHLPNTVQIHPKVLSGGVPEGDAAFAELVSLGIKTVISVDGAKPDVAVAKAHGMRYVHLPHGYDGIPEERVTALAKAIGELDGPIYLHCHHGKHRSPAAASVACIAAGLISPATGGEVLKIAGTSQDYRGLFHAVAQARPIDAVILAKSAADFPETAEIPPMAQAMVQLEQCQHQLQLAANVGWISPPTHPDIEPQHQALLLREHFTELLRTNEARHHDADFRNWLKESEGYAKRIETTLKDWKRSPDNSPPAALSESLRGISSNCKACHVKYRDNTSAN